MLEKVEWFVDVITLYLQQFGIPFGILLIVLESIIPVLPLGIFIAFNMMAFGNVLGFVISWISTCVGCVLAYFLFSKLFSGFLFKSASKKQKLNKVIKAINKIKFSKLVLIVALPFTPAFLVNIACGLTNVPLRKFIYSILIGKLSIVYFWGYIGKSFLDSITDINTIFILCLLLSVTYLISKIINRKLNIE